MSVRGVVRPLWWAGIVVLAAGAISLSAQEYPVKPIRILTSEPGGGNDFAARLLAPGLAAGLGQQVVIDNRPGIVATEAVAKSPPDGYSILFAGAGVWISPMMRDHAWDPVRDFAPVTVISNTSLLLVVHPSLPVKSVKELIALAKARPGALNYATGPIGVTNHLAGELFKSLAGVNIVHVPYKGNGPATNALVAGEAQLMFATLGPALQFMKSGRLRVLGVTTPARSVLVAGVPTVAETLPGFAVAIHNSAWAPAKTPDAVIRRLVSEFQRVLAQPDVKEKFMNTGNEVVGSTPEHLGSLMKADIARLSKVIRDSGLREK